MKSSYPPKVQRAVDSLLTTDGTCAPALRQAVESYAAQLSMGQRETSEIPDVLIAYVDKVTQHAYKVTDKDVQALKDAGYSEDAIFEITLCASVGASRARLESGLSAVKEAGYAFADS